MLNAAMQKNIAKDVALQHFDTYVHVNRKGSHLLGPHNARREDIFHGNQNQSR